MNHECSPASTFRHGRVWHLVGRSGPRGGALSLAQSVKPVTLCPRCARTAGGEGRADNVWSSCLDTPYVAEQCFIFFIAHLSATSCLQIFAKTVSFIPLPGSERAALCHKTVHHTTRDAPLDIGILRAATSSIEHIPFTSQVSIFLRKALKQGLMARGCTLCVQRLPHKKVISKHFKIGPTFPCLNHLEERLLDQARIFLIFPPDTWIPSFLLTACREIGDL